MFRVAILLLWAKAEIFDLTTPQYSEYFADYQQGLQSYIPAGHPVFDRIDPEAYAYGMMCWVKITYKSPITDGAIYTVSKPYEKLFNLYYSYRTAAI